MLSSHLWPLRRRHLAARRAALAGVQSVTRTRRGSAAIRWQAGDGDGDDFRPRGRAADDNNKFRFDSHIISLIYITRRANPFAAAAAADRPAPINVFFAAPPLTARATPTRGSSGRLTTARFEFDCAIYGRATDLTFRVYRAAAAADRWASLRRLQAARLIVCFASAPWAHPNAIRAPGLPQGRARGSRLAARAEPLGRQSVCLSVCLAVGRRPPTGRAINFSRLVSVPSGDIRPFGPPRPARAVSISRSAPSALPRLAQVEARIRGLASDHYGRGAAPRDFSATTSAPSD